MMTIGFSVGPSFRITTKIHPKKSAESKMNSNPIVFMFPPKFLIIRTPINANKMKITWKNLIRSFNKKKAKIIAKTGDIYRKATARPTLRWYSD